MSSKLLEIDLEKLANSSQLSPIEEQAFSSLSLSETLQSDHWKYRKKALEILRISPLQIPFEISCFIEENLDIFISDLNPGSFYEFLLFLHEKTPDFVKKSLFLEKILERYPFLSSVFQAKIGEILHKNLEKSDFYEEILKKFDSKNPRILSQISQLLLSFFFEKSLEISRIPDEIFREIFTKSLNLLESLSKEVRNLALDIIKSLFPYIKEDFSELLSYFKALRPIHMKKLKEIADNCEKNHDISLLKTMKFPENHDISLRKSTSFCEEKADLSTFFPEKFFKIPYNFEPDYKRKAVIEACNLLQNKNPNISFDFSKDYSQIFNILSQILDDKNLVVFTEGIKLFQQLISLFKRNFPIIRMKNCIRILIEKGFSSKKSKNISFFLTILQEILDNSSMSFGEIIDVLFVNLENNAKNSAKILCLDCMDNLLEKGLAKKGFCENLLKKVEIFAGKAENNTKIKKKIKEFVNNVKKNIIEKNIIEKNIIEKNIIEKIGDFSNENECFDLERELENDSIYSEKAVFLHKITEFLHKAKGKSSLHDFLRFLVRNLKKKLLFERLYEPYLEFLLYFNINFDIKAEFTLIFSKELKSLIINCPKTLEKIDDFQRFLSFFLENTINLPIILDLTIKLLEKLSSDLKYLYSIEKSQIFLRILVFSLVEALKRSNDFPDKSIFKGFLARISNVKLPGLINLHRPLSQFLSQFSQFNEETEDFYHENGSFLDKKEELEGFSEVESVKEGVYKDFDSVELMKPDQWALKSKELSRLLHEKEMNDDKNKENSKISSNLIKENPGFFIKENSNFINEKSNFINEKSKFIIENLNFLKEKSKENPILKENPTFTKENANFLKETSFIKENPKETPIIKENRNFLYNSSFLQSQCLPDLQSPKTPYEEILDELHKLLHPVSKHWKRGIGRGVSIPDEDTQILIKKAFFGFEEVYKDRFFPLILEIKELFPSFSKEIIEGFFENIVKKAEFKDSKEYYEGFLAIFLRNFEKDLILKGFSECFSRCLCENSRENTHKMLRNGLFPLIYRLLNDQIAVENIEFLAESLVFCLLEPGLSQVGNEIMKKLYKKNCDQITEKFEKVLLKNQRLFVGFKAWVLNERPMKNYELLESFHENEEKKEENKMFLGKNQGFLMKNLENASFLQESSFKNKEENPAFSQENSLLRNTEENPAFFKKQQENPCFSQENSFKKQEENPSFSQENSHKNKEENPSFSQENSHKNKEENPEKLTNFLKKKVIINEDLLDLFENSHIISHCPPQIDYQKEYNELLSRNSELEALLKQANTEYLLAISQNCELSEKLKEKCDNSKISQIYQKTSSFYQKTSQIANDYHESVEIGDLFTNIKQLQEVFLCLDDDTDFIDNFIGFYSSNLKDFSQKKSMISELKIAIISSKFLNNLSSISHKMVLHLILRLCCSENTQKSLISHPGTIEKDLQLILDALLKAKKAEKTIISLISIINSSLPIDFSKELSHETKLFFKLLMKCLEKTQGNGVISKGFKVLMEIYKLFKRFPPENLTEEMVNIVDFEAIYKGVKRTCDWAMNGGILEAKEFYEVVKEGKGVFLEYVSGVLNKK